MWSPPKRRQPSKKTKKPKNTTIIEINDVETHGFTSAEARKKHMLRKAEEYQNQAEMKKAMASSLRQSAHEVDQIIEQARKMTQQMVKAGKIRLDGKTGDALHSRGLTQTCGMIKLPTRIIASGDYLVKEEVWWSDRWIADLVQQLKDAGADNALRKKFYDSIQNHPGDKEAIEAEAGLIALKASGSEW